MRKVNKDPINLYLYEQSSSETLASEVLEHFTRSGESSAWFKINFTNPKDDRETDYVDEFFIFEQSRVKRLEQCAKIIKIYSDWLLKVDPDRKVLFDNAVKAVEQLQAMNDRPLKDSGERRDFSTGSRRDVATGKGRYDLLPFEVIDALAKHYEKGYQKYDPDHQWWDVDNWQKGQPLSVFLDSGLRHAFKWKAGQMDEDHLIAAIWNLIAAWWTQDQIRKGELPIELGDTGELWRQNRDLTKRKK